MIVIDLVSIFHVTCVQFWTLLSNLFSAFGQYRRQVWNWVAIAKNWPKKTWKFHFSCKFRSIPKHLFCVSWFPIIASDSAKKIGLDWYKKPTDSCILHQKKVSFFIAYSRNWRIPIFSLPPWKATSGAHLFLAIPRYISYRVLDHIEYTQLL